MRAVLIAVLVMFFAAAPAHAAPPPVDLVHSENVQVGPYDVRASFSARDQWGLDIRALPAEGVWRLEFAIDGPKGEGRGALAVPVGPRPDPPAAVSWTVGLGPLIIGAIVAAIAWARRRGTRTNAWTWS